MRRNDSRDIVCGASSRPGGPDAPAWPFGRSTFTHQSDRSATEVGTDASGLARADRGQFVSGSERPAGRAVLGLSLAALFLTAALVLGPGARAGGAQPGTVEIVYRSNVALRAA